jgi:hypothetical protein
MERTLAQIRVKTTFSSAAWLQTFETDILIRCDRCHKRALVSEIVAEKDRVPSRKIAKASCDFCLLKWQIECAYPAAESLPLWLRTDFRGHSLWAYNARHLNWLYSFVVAELREDTILGGSAALHAVLPRWMTSSKNRDGVKKALNKLQLKLSSDS